MAIAQVKVVTDRASRLATLLSEANEQAGAD